MEILVISAIFIGIAFGGAALAATLIVKAVVADQRYLEAFERPTSVAVSEPAWVDPQSGRQPLAA